MYEYNAIVTKVYDGDTITCDIDLGMYVWLRNQKIRLAGIDAPELYTGTLEERLKGRDAQRTLSDMILARHVTLKTIQDKTEKYGRWLATITIFSDVGTTLNINQWLLDNGFAVPLKYP